MIGNATNQGIYGIAQISGRTYDLRNYVQRALNRGEAYHQLRRAISNVNGDQFCGSSDEEIHLWNECARLVANAIIHFNSTILSQLMPLLDSLHQKSFSLVIPANDEKSAFCDSLL